MTERQSLNGGFSWTHLLPTIGLMAAIAGGSWAVFQVQFASLQQTIVLAKAAVDKDAETLRQNTEAQTSRHEAALLRLQKEYISHDEFAQFQARIEDIKKRIEAIEATRPTADTLQTVSTGLERRITENQSDVRAANNRIADFLSRLAKDPVERPELNSVQEHLKTMDSRLDNLVKALPPR